MKLGSNSFALILDPILMVYFDQKILSIHIYIKDCQYHAMPLSMENYFQASTLWALTRMTTLNTLNLTC